MKKATKYSLIFLISGILLLIALSINNMFWLSASPEWETVFTVHNSIGYWTGPVQDYSTAELTSYLLQYRIYTVWTNLRDIGSALIVGFMVTLSVFLADLYKSRKH